MNLSQFWQQMIQLHVHLMPREMAFSHIDGWEMFKNLAKRDKHDLSSIASPKGERKSSFNGTSLFNSPTSSTLCGPTLAKLNQETEFCITKHIPLCDSDVHIGTTFSVPRSSSETHRVSD